MRIISGQFRGRKLKTLEGMNTRPTADRVKESLFNILNTKVYDANVLDLFAGSGALGLEALSRGAASCVFVDSSKEAIDIVKENVDLCKVQENSKIINKDYLEVLKNINNKFDIIFVDPPYSKGIEIVVLENVKDILTEDGMVIIETDHTDIPPEEINGLIKYDSRKYGRTIISFYEHNKKKVL
ncbi:MAG: 16S rRNA (guanine(966)-N(2))-methyltransferase RsmD [Clostridiales bacterium]|nr:16S rRNA (guanine(966)-N(2))-methyltransferase RsmD [Clostridiales bacterium]